MNILFVTTKKSGRMTSIWLMVWDGQHFCSPQARCPRMALGSRTQGMQQCLRYHLNVQRHEIQDASDLIEGVRIG